MMKRLNRRYQRLLPVAVFALVTLWPTVEVLAQAAPPQPALKRAPPVWMGMGVMFVLFAMVVAFNLFPSKRSHQD